MKEIPLSGTEKEKILTLKISDFAKEIGLEPDEQGRYTFLPEHDILAYEYAERFVKENNAQAIEIDGVASPGVIASLLHGAHPAETYLVSFNPQTSEKNRIKILEPVPEVNGRGPEYFSWHKEEKDDYTLVEFNLSGNFNAEDLSKVIPPEVDPQKPVIISGRGPLYLTHTIAAGYRHFKGLPAVAFYQPASNFGPAKGEIGISHSDEYPLGTVFENLEDIGKAREKFLEEISKKGEEVKKMIEEGASIEVNGDSFIIKSKDGREYKILLKNIIEG